MTTFARSYLNQAKKIRIIKEQHRKVVMSKKIKTFLILILAIISTNIFSASFVPSQTQREKLFDSYLNKATYGQEQYEDRINIYTHILPLIGQGVSDEKKNSFSTALSGLFQTRSQDNPERLSLLKDLFKMAASNVGLVNKKNQIQGWITTINKELEPFALCDGDIVMFIGNDDKIQLFCDTQKSENGKYRLQIQGGKSTNFGPQLFKIKSKKEKLGTLFYGDEIEIIPLYSEYKKSFYMLSEVQRLSVATNYKRGSAQCDLEIVDLAKKIKKSKDVATTIVLRQNRKQEKNQEPVLANDHIQIWSKEPRKRVAIDSDSLTLIFGDDLQTKDKFYFFKIQKIMPDEVAKVENTNFINNLNNLKKQKDFFTKIRRAVGLSNFLNSNIYEKNKEEFFAQLENLFDACNRKDLNALKTLRTFYYQLFVSQKFEDKNSTLQAFLEQINDDLIPFAINYDDIIQIDSSKFKRTLWTHGKDGASDSDCKEILVGPNSDARSQDGPQFFKLKSVNGKTGPIEYGDEVEIFALYVGFGANVEALDQPEKLCVNNSSRRDKSDGQSVFQLKAATFNWDKYLNCSVPALYGESLEVWNKDTDRKVWTNHGSMFGSNWYELLVGPNDDEYKGINRTENGQQLFELQKVSYSKICTVASNDFYQKLLKAQNLDDGSEKIEEMAKLSSRLSQNILSTKKEAYVTELASLFSRRKSFNTGQLEQLRTLLNKSLSADLYNEQKDKVALWMHTLDTEMVENEVLEKLTLAERQKDFLEKIAVYDKTLEIIKNPLAKNKTELFFKNVDGLYQQKEKMDVVQLSSFKNLMNNVLIVAPSLQQTPQNLLWAESFNKKNKEIDFLAKLSDAAVSHGQDQVKKYNDMIPLLSSNVSGEQKLNYMRSLRQLLNSKLNELQAVKDVLQNAVAKTDEK